MFRFVLDNQALECIIHEAKIDLGQSDVFEWILPYSVQMMRQHIRKCKNLDSTEASDLKNQIPRRVHFFDCMHEYVLHLREEADYNDCHR